MDTLKESYEHASNKEKWLSDLINSKKIKVIADIDLYVYYDLTCKDYACNKTTKISILYNNKPIWQKENEELYEHGFKKVYDVKEAINTIKRIENSRGWEDSLNLATFLYDFADNVVKDQELRDLIDDFEDYSSLFNIDNENYNFYRQE